MFLTHFHTDKSKDSLYYSYNYGYLAGVGKEGQTNKDTGKRTHISLFIFNLKGQTNIDTNTSEYALPVLVNK